MRDIDDAFAKEMKLSGIFGVYISQVVKNGAADKAGIKEGDILVRIDSSDVNKGSAVREQINRYRPGDNVELKVIRDGKERVFRAKLTGEEELIASLSADQTTVIFGARMRAASDETLKKVGLKHGVEVVDAGGGRINDAGIKPGFVITHIDGNKVVKIEDVEKIIRQSRRSVSIECVGPNGVTSYHALGLR